MKIKMNKQDVFVEIICLVLLIGILLYLFLNWDNIPDRIPVHYNVMGQANRIVNKGEIIVFPIIAWMVYIGLTVTKRIPRVWSTGVKVTEENKERVYRVEKSMVRTLKLIIIVVFVFLIINSTQTTSLPAWFHPVFLILLFGSIIFYGIKRYKVSK